MPLAFMLITKVCDYPSTSKTFLMDVVELAPLRPRRHRMGKPYVEAYFREYPVSEPAEDQDDRNALYCL